jgi:hypothetical protein
MSKRIIRRIVLAGSSDLDRDLAQNDVAKVKADELARMTYDCGGSNKLFRDHNQNAKKKRNRFQRFEFVCYQFTITNPT